MSIEMRALALTPAEIVRFHSKVAPPTLGGSCRLWTGGNVNENGYGRFVLYRDGRDIKVLAHRLAYYLATNDDPGPLDVRHACDTRLCCEPSDLSPGTRADNMQDAIERGRLNTDGLAVAAEERTRRRLALLAAGLKNCSRCKKALPVAEFGLNRREEDGLQNECRACRRISQALYKARRRARSAS